MSRLLLPPPGTLPGENLRAVLVGAGFLLIFAAAEAWRRGGGPPVEWTRKLVHFAGGLLVAAFPWLFASPWTVVALAVAFAAIIGLSRRLRLLGSVHDVERRSEGALYYPVAVCVLFLVSRHRPVLYLISVLTLILSDTLAAVLGSAYGRRIYEVETDRKSIEGSAVFFLTTFLVVHLPLLLLTPIDRGASVLIGLQVALLVTSFEAISLHGSDNLMVPLGTCYLLVKMMPRPAEWLGLLLLAQIGIIAVTALLACRTHFLTFSGGIATQLVLYGALSLGGPRWLLPVVLALAGLMVAERRVARQTGAPTRLRRVPARARVGGYQVLAVFYVSLVPALLLLVSNTVSTLQPRLLRSGTLFYGPFVGALAAQMGFLIYELLSSRARKRRPPAAGRALAAAAISFGVVVPASLWVATGRLLSAGLAVAAVLDFGAVMVYALARRGRRPAEPVRVLQLQSACAGLVTVLVLPLSARWPGPDFASSTFRVSSQKSSRPVAYAASPSRIGRG